MPYPLSSEHTRIVRDHCEKRIAAVDHNNHPDGTSDSENEYPSLHAAASVVSPSNNATSASRLQPSSVSVQSRILEQCPDQTFGPLILGNQLGTRLPRNALNAIICRAKPSPLCE